MTFSSALDLYTQQHEDSATSAFDDFSRSRYDKLWRISVLRVVVSFLFRIAILCLNAHGIWYLVAGRQKLQRHWPLPPLVLAVVLPIKSTRPICTRSNCPRNARNVVNAMRPLPNRSRKPVLFVTELLQSLRNGHVNEREPRRNRSENRLNRKSARNGQATRHLAATVSGTSSRDDRYTRCRHRRAARFR